jgi:hypothetical protein
LIAALAWLFFCGSTSIMADNSSPTRIGTPGGEVVISTPAEHTAYGDDQLHHDWSAPEFTGGGMSSALFALGSDCWRSGLEPGAVEAVICGVFLADRRRPACVQTHTQEN